MPAILKFGAQERSVKYLLTFLFISLAVVALGQKTWTLQECVTHAIDNNIQIKQSELDVERTNQRYIESRAGALPNLNAFASHGYNWGQRIDPFTNAFATQRVQTNNFGLSSNVTLFNGLQTINNMKQTKFDLLAGRYNVDKMKNDIAMNLATNYLQILFNGELLEIAAKQVQTSRLQLERLKAMEEQGQIARGPVLDMGAQLANDELNVVNRQNALDLSYLSLTQMMQLSRENAALFRIAKPNLTSIDPSELQNTPGQVFDQAQRVLPEVKSAELTVNSAAVGLSSARGGRYPQITLNGSLGTGYSGARKELVGSEILTVPFSDQVSDNVYQTLSFSLNVPVFNGWAVNGSVNRAKIASKSAAYNLQLTKDQLQQDVQQAFADASAAYKRYSAADNAVGAMRESFKFAEVRFNQNMITNVEYTDAANKLYQSESEVIQAKYDYLFRVKVIEFYQGKALSF